MNKLDISDISLWIGWESQAKSSLDEAGKIIQQSENDNVKSESGFDIHEILGISENRRKKINSKNRGFDETFFWEIDKAETNLLSEKTEFET